MTISALVITLVDADEESRGALQALSRDDRLSLGPRAGRRLPVVAESPSLADGKRLFEGLRELSGVAHVDVVSVHFENFEKNGSWNEEPS